MNKEIAHFWKYLDAHRNVAPISELLIRTLTEDNDLEITPNLLHMISREFGSRLFDSYLSPPDLAAFVAEIAATRTPTSILDPTCGSGLMLKAVADRVQAKTIHGIEINITTASVAQRLLGDGATVFRGNCLSESLSLMETYDLVISEPPFGMRLNRPTSIEGVDGEHKWDFSDALACWTCSKLSTDGMAVMILPSSFIWSKRSEAAKKTIRALGCAITTCIQIPSGSLQGTSIEAYIVVIERGEEDIVFTGQYTTDHEHQRVLVKNMRARRVGKRPAQGRLCLWEGFRGYTAIESVERIQKMASRLGFIAVPMRDLVLKAAKTNKAKFKRLEPRPNCVYLPCTGRGKTATSQDRLSGKLKDYVQLQINPERADARFVAEVFNRELGQLVLDSIRSSTVIDRFGISDLMEAEFYLPSPGTQAKVQGLLERIAAIRGETNELESALWSGTPDVDRLAKQVATINQKDRFVDWIETLPFSLASILWRHCAADGSVRERYEILLHFFEALAEFIATIHLSVFSSDSELWIEHSKGLHEALYKQNLTLARATFGTWKCVVEYLGSRCRKMMNENHDICGFIYRTHSQEVLEMLTDSQMFSALQSANSIRNTWYGHVGTVSDRQAEMIHSELFALVQSCRGVFGRSWQDYELVQPSKCRFSEGLFRYKVRRMVGTRTPFEMVERACIEGLEDGSLYLLDPNCDRGLRLLPFVRMMPSPPSEANACYFFNRTQGDESRYVSYHFEDESEVTGNFADMAEALKLLSRGSLEEGVLPDVH